MKDFLNAYDKVTGTNLKGAQTEKSFADTDATKKKTERDNDPDTLALADATARAKLARINQTISQAGVRMANENADRKAVTNFYNSATANNSTAPPAGAIQTADPSLTEYAEGGLVTDASDDDDEEADLAAESAPTPARALTPVPTPRPAIPATADAPTDVTDFSSRGRGGGGGGAAMPRTPPAAPEVMANGAVRGAYDYTNRILAAGGSGGIKTREQLARAQAIASGQGGMSPEEMAAAGKAVDPEGKMTEGTRNMVALGSVYQYWANKGDPEKAQRVAFQMLQHYRAASTRYAAIAAAAAESGNLDLMQKAAIKAYANVPDGRDMALTPDPDDPSKLVYSFTDEHGKTVLKGVASPREIAAGAMGLAKGGFDKALLTAAGQKEQDQAGAKGAGAGGGKPQTAADRKGEGELMDAEIKKRTDAWDKEQENKPEKERIASDDPKLGGYYDKVRDAATHLMRQNAEGVTHREAVTMAEQLLTPAKADPEKDPFKIKPVMADGERTGKSTVEFDDGKQITMADSSLSPILQARRASVSAAVDKINKDMEASDAADEASARRAEGVKGVLEGLSAYNKKKADEYNTAGGELLDKVTSSPRERLSAAGDTISKAFDWVRSKSPDKAVPDTLDDRAGD